jgi:hypothetical protein
MIAGIMWDWVWTGVAVWAIVAAIPLALLALGGLIYLAALGVARLLDWWQRRRWGAFNPAQDLLDTWEKQAKDAKGARPDKPMQAQKLDHIKYDILPDGTLGPGDPRGLEDPE